MGQIKISGIVRVPSAIDINVATFLIGVAIAKDNEGRLKPVPPPLEKDADINRTDKDGKPIYLKDVSNNEALKVVDPPTTDPNDASVQMYTIDDNITFDLDHATDLYVIFPSSHIGSSHIGQHDQRITLCTDQVIIYQADPDQAAPQVHVDDMLYESEDYPISGRIERPFGAEKDNKTVPLTDVQVILLDKDYKQIDQTVTDAEGQYSFEPEQKKDGGLTDFNLRFPAQVTSLNDTLFLEEPNIQIRTQKGEPFVVPTIVYKLDVAHVAGRVMDGFHGLEGVTVVALEVSTMTRVEPPGKTVEGGYFEISLPHSGTYKLAFPSPFKDPKTGETWELQDGSQAVQTIIAKAGEDVQAEVVRYQREEHKIVWFVEMQGQPAAGILVEIWQGADPTAVFIDQKRTDFQGTVEFVLAKPGQYRVKVVSDEAKAQGIFERTVDVNSTFRGKSNIPGRPKTPVTGGSGGGGAAFDGEIKEALIDSQAYPVLTEPVSTTTGLGPAVSAPGRGLGGGLPLSTTVEAALRDVLSWRPKASDPRGFLTALRQSFELTDYEGHVDATWTPRSYAATVQDDLGAVTGAQASIYARARAALDQSVPLLEGLYPLITTTMENDIDASRAIVHAQMTQLVDELGTVGGPRVPRVDELFGYLLGSSPSSDPEKVGGSLKALGDRLGMQRKFVNTIEDEQNFTNYLILIDYVYTLQVSWKNQSKYFSRVANGPEPFLGTQLVLLSQALTAVAEATQRTYFAMDSVFLGPSERQTISLEFLGGISLPVVPGDTDMNVRNGTYTFDAEDTPMFVSELLDWIDRVASHEGPQLIQDAGKDGVIAIFPTINRLRKLVHGAMTITSGGVQNPTLQPLPDGYATARVQRALEELASQLDDSARLAGQIVLRARQLRADLTGQDFMNQLNAALQDPALVNLLRILVQSGQSNGSGSAPGKNGSGQNGGAAPSTPGGNTGPIFFPPGSIDILRDGLISREFRPEPPVPPVNNQPNP